MKLGQPYILCRPASIRIQTHDNRTEDECINSRTTVESFAIMIISQNDSDN